MRKTKIVCTMGPSTDKPGILRQLMENGMNVARFNFSHGDYEEHKAALTRCVHCPRSWICHCLYAGHQGSRDSSG